MADRDQSRYEILRDLALAGTVAEKWQESARSALEQVCGLVGLEAAALILWDDEGEVAANVSYAGSEKTAQKLTSIENDLFYRLRRDQELESAHLSFGGPEPTHSFTMPLRHGERLFGAVIGFQTGERTAVSEDVFLGALTCALALQVIAGGASGTIPKKILDKERLAAILETAVTVNHEINNPLTAILGNVQLLLLKRDNLDDDLRGKLDVIEKSAAKIKDVTQKLLRLTSARTADYTEGTTMIDLSEPDSDEGGEES